MVTSNIRRYGRYRLVPKCGTCGWYSKPDEKGPPTICPECGDDCVFLMPGRYFWVDKYTLGFRTGFSKAYFEPRGLGKIEKIVVNKYECPLPIALFSKIKGNIPVLKGPKIIGYYKGGVYDDLDNIIVPCSMVDDLNTEFIKNHNEWMFIGDQQKPLRAIVAAY